MKVKRNRIEEVYAPRYERWVGARKAGRLDGLSRLSRGNTALRDSIDLRARRLDHLRPLLGSRHR